MNRKLNEETRSIAFEHGMLLSENDLKVAIVAREKRLQELEEELKYFRAQLVGYLAAVRKRNLLRGKNE